MVILTSMAIRAGLAQVLQTPCAQLGRLWGPGRECVIVNCFTLHWVTHTGVKGTSHTPTITSLILLFPHRGTSILRAELQQCQLQHQQWQLALPCSHPAGTAHPGTTGQSLVQHKVSSCLSGCLGGELPHPSLGFLKSLSREGVKNQKRAARAACMRVGEVWETELSPAAAPSAGGLDVPLG